jgi:hypothetical protein
LTESKRVLNRKDTKRIEQEASSAARESRTLFGRRGKRRGQGRRLQDKQSALQTPELVRQKTNLNNKSCRMKTKGPIVVIEDDRDDQELLEETFKVLNYPNKVIFFSDGYEALKYIEKTETPPFSHSF